jgi:DNA-binding IclR family transcriptional regulator
MAVASPGTHCAYHRDDQARAPITLPQIVKTLGRSTGELFRMIQVLQFRGFIEQSQSGSGYQLTGRLLGMVMDQPLVKGLIDIALPRMGLLSEETGQSCHLVMHSQGQIVVVARVESRNGILRKGGTPAASAGNSIWVCALRLSDQADT